MTTERDELLKEEREEPKHETFGLSLMALAALFFAVQSFLVRYVTAYGTLPVSTVVLVRGITQTILGLLTTAIVPDGRDVFNNTPRLWWLLALRGFAGAVAIVALFLSFSMVPLSVASSLYYTSSYYSSSHAQHNTTNQLVHRSSMGVNLRSLRVARTSMPQNRPSRIHKFSRRCTRDRPIFT